MNRLCWVHSLVLSGILLALGVLFPTILHWMGNAGPVFLPMHWPVFLAGALLSPGWALSVGLITPLLAGLLTGMPAFPFALIMMLELGTYAGFYSWLDGKGKPGSRSRSTVQKTLQTAGKLLLAMIGGRLVRIGASVVLMPLLMGVPFSLPLVAAAVFVQGLPGIALQLLVLPVFLQKAGRAIGWNCRL